MKYIVTLRGKSYEVEVEAGEAMLLAEYEAAAPVAPTAPAAAPAAVAAPAPAAPAPAAVPAGSGEPVVAPMPGNILQINAVAGQKVSAGDVLVVLEAMKMENEILAPRDGVVNQVLTTKGATVETGAALLTLA